MQTDPSKLKDVAARYTARRYDIYSSTRHTGVAGDKSRVRQLARCHARFAADEGVIYTFPSFS